MTQKGIDQNEMKELLKEYEENPFDPNRKSPADVMRIFFQFNTSIIPVISRRNILLGIITKEAITAEMSDIARFSSVSIDKFISKIARKFSFDELISIVTENREFTIINLFGEIQGSWSRLQLLSACENESLTAETIESEVDSQVEEQKIQWMVYHVLEYIPRPLYAVNEKGKTVFYNLHFEDMYLSKTGKAEVDAIHVETVLSDKSRNDFLHREGSGEIYFHSKDINWYYEKIPMKDSHDAVNGYLYYFGRDVNESDNSSTVSVDGDSLISILENAERSVIVKTLDECGKDADSAAKKLKVPKNSFLAKIKKYGIIVG